MTVPPGPLQGQLERLAHSFPGSSATALSDGSVLVTVPGVRLPPGWSQPATTVGFIVPVGYPIAKPDCFYTDAGLRLANGALPMNANPQQVPHTTELRLWFSWHLASWNPGKDSLLNYLRVIQDRLARTQ